MKLFELNEFYCDLDDWIKNLQEADKMTPYGEAKARIKLTIEKMEQKQRKLGKLFATMIPDDYLKAKNDPQCDVHLLLAMLRSNAEYRKGNEAKIMSLVMQILRCEENHYPIELLSSNEICVYLYDGFAQYDQGGVVKDFTEWLQGHLEEYPEDLPWFRGMRQKLLERHQLFGFQDGQPLNQQTHKLVTMYDALLSMDSKIK